jgi:F-type H+-transporting ATPase subunit b
VKLSALKKLLPALIMAAILFAPVNHAVAQSNPPADSGGGRLTTPEGQSKEASKQEVDENDQYIHSAAVRALGAKIGLNAEQAATAFTVANFVVLAALVGWFLAKTLPKTFRDRNTNIQKSLVDARTATEEASARLSTVEERLSKLDEQIAALRAQADKDSALDEQRRTAHQSQRRRRKTKDPRRSGAGDQRSDHLGPAPAPAVRRRTRNRPGRSQARRHRRDRPSPRPELRAQAHQ